MNWELTASEGNKQRGYDFVYDGLSRLMRANYLENGVVSDKFGTSYEYDKHENMLSSVAFGYTGTSGYGAIDRLRLTYNGNQLRNVEDSVTQSPALSASMDFRDGANQDIEYVYDANGNQIKDLSVLLMLSKREADVTATIYTQ